MDVKTEQYERRVQQLEAECKVMEGKCNDLTEKCNGVESEMEKVIKSLEVMWKVVWRANERTNDCALNSQDVFFFTKSQE